jgi:hypothetical protein
MVFKFLIGFLLIAILTACSSKVAIFEQTPTAVTEKRPTAVAEKIPAAVFENKSIVIFEHTSIKDTKIAQKQYRKDSSDCQVYSYQQVPPMSGQSQKKGELSTSIAAQAVMAQKSHHISLRKRVFKACMYRKNWTATEEELIEALTSATQK